MGGIYVRPGKWRREVMNGITHELENYARENACKVISFYTRRDGRGFERLMGGGWRVDSVVMKRDVP